MPTFDDVLAELERQRRSFEEFKAIQAARLDIAEKEIRALLHGKGGSNRRASAGGMGRGKQCTA